MARGFYVPLYLSAPSLIVTATVRGRDGGHPAPKRGHVRLFALWFGLLGGFVAWTLQTLVNLPVAAHGCYPQLAPLSHPVIAVRGLAFTVSVAAVLVSAAAMFVAWRSWSRTREENQGSSGAGDAHGPAAALLETGEGRTRFMALAGVLTSGGFLLLTAVHALTIFLVGPCI